MTAIITKPTPAMKNHGLKVGDKIEVVYHHHDSTFNASSNDRGDQLPWYTVTLEGFTPLPGRPPIRKVAGTCMANTDHLYIIS